MYSSLKLCCLASNDFITKFLLSIFLVHSNIYPSELLIQGTSTCPKYELYNLILI